MGANCVSERVRAKLRYAAHTEVLCMANNEARHKTAVVSPTSYEQVLGILLRSHVRR